jgi:two-component system response regulator YesN
MHPLVASTALGALQLLAKHRVDIVITDHALSGMDGLQLLDTVRARWPHCQRVLLTRYASPDIIITAVNQCGVSKILVKSMHPLLMREELERMCAEVPREGVVAEVH